MNALIFPTVSVAVVLASAAPAAAQVRLVGLFPQGMLFMDMASVSRTTSAAQTRLHMVLKSPAAVSREAGGYHWVQRVDYRIEFDCTQARSRVLGSAMVDFGGQPIGTETPPGPWEPIVPGTPGEGARELACGERREGPGDYANIDDAAAVVYSLQAEENARGY